MLFWKVISVFYVLIYVTSCQRLSLTCNQIRAFVDGHNQRRYHIAQGMVPRQPPAADMKYIAWDEELAEKAARWSENRIFGHNPDKTIWSRRWQEVGENVFISKYHPPPQYTGLVKVEPNIEEALSDWFGENKNYFFEPFHLGTPFLIGHYTQMIWAESTRVGCGITQWVDNYGWTNTLFVCNYGPTGNVLDKLPYLNSYYKGYLWCPEENLLCQKLYGLYC